MSTDRCYWLKNEDGEEILIPMCYGSAAGGEAGCTCRVPESRIEAAERGRAEAEGHVLKLREARDRRLEEQRRDWNERRRLRQRITELETMLADRSS